MGCRVTDAMFVHFRDGRTAISLLKDGNDLAVDKFGRFHTKISNSIMSFCDTEENFSENSTAMSPHLSDTNSSLK